MSKRTTHAIPPDVNNSTIEYLIAERIRYEQNREILSDWWFQNMSFKRLADKYNCSESHIKDIVYGFGDPLLSEAAKIDGVC